MKKLILPILVVVALLPACNNNEPEATLLDSFYQESGQLVNADLDSIGHFASKFHLAIAHNYDMASDPLCLRIDSNIQYALDCQIIGISQEEE